MSEVMKLLPDLDDHVALCHYQQQTAVELLPCPGRAWCLSTYLTMTTVRQTSDRPGLIPCRADELIDSPQCKLWGLHLHDLRHIQCRRLVCAAAAVAVAPYPHTLLISDPPLPCWQATSACLPAGGLSLGFKTRGLQPCPKGRCSSSKKSHC